jgi:hypothetical protein
MSELAVHLPHVPIRPWVFTGPVPLRYQPAVEAALTRAVPRVFLRECRPLAELALEGHVMERP